MFWKCVFVGCGLFWFRIEIAGPDGGDDDQIIRSCRRFGRRGICEKMTVGGDDSKDGDRNEEVEERENVLVLWWMEERRQRREQEVVDKGKEGSRIKEE